MEDKGGFFYREEFIFNNDNLLKNISTISSIVKEIESQGVKVVIAVVPIKARIYKRFLPYGYNLPSVLEDRYSEIQTRLLEKGVRSVNLNEPFLENNANDGMTSLYYYQDTHWSPYGASIAAKIVAEQITAIVTSGEIKSVLSVRSNTTEDRLGDICNFLSSNMEKICSKRKYKSFSYAVSNESSDLLGENETPNIVVVGTSYSSILNFVPDLAFNLQMDTLNESVPGKGFYYPMKTYLKSTNFNLNKPKVIVWEIPERQLQADPETP